METRTEKRNKIQAPTLVAIVVGLHVMAVGSIVFIQGCGTPPRRADVDPPPAPEMPPDPEITEAHPPAPEPVFQPPVAVEEAPPEMPPADPQVYEVRPGDNLSTIASRHGVTTAELVDLNQLANADAIQVGQTLLLPAHASVSPAPEREQPAPEPAVDGATYVVQPGDSLSRIASRHGVSVSALASANNISDPDRISVGDELVIPGADDEPAPSPQPQPQEPQPQQPDPGAALAPAPADPEFADEHEPFPYEVRAGDTVESVARDFAVLKDDVLTLNNMTGDESLRPGQTLMIPPLR